MEEIYIFYLFSQFISEFSGAKTTITRDEYYPLLKTNKGELYNLKDFCEAFNEEMISDLGYIFIVKNN